jgi:Holliday junction resolvase RusA-like endonuclease
MRDTSLTAYQQLKPKLSSLEQDVLIYLNIYPDHTDKELAKLAGKTRINDIDNIRKRRADLTRKGIVVSSGKKVCEVSGLKCHTWRIKR